MSDLIDRSPRRELRPSSAAEFFSRLVACFLGTLFGTFVAGFALLLILRAYWQWSVKSTMEEVSQKMEEERKKNPQPVFTMPIYPDPWGASSTAKKK